MKKIAFYILFITYVFPVHGQTVSKAPIGRTYKLISEIEQFKSYKEEEGIVILPMGTGNCFSKISNGNNTMILFTKYIAPASYKILAVLDIGSIDINSQIVAMARCRINGKNDGNIVALVKPSGGDYFKSIIKAWRVDEKNHKFVNISTKGLECANDGDMAD